jgi:hypothetical protein
VSTYEEASTSPTGKAQLLNRTRVSCFVPSIHQTTITTSYASGFRHHHLITAFIPLKPIKQEYIEPFKCGRSDGVAQTSTEGAVQDS